MSIEAHDQANSAGNIPQPSPILAVDLDGTVLRTDLLHESLVALACQRPIDFLYALPSLLEGKAAFKRSVAKRVSPDFENLPVNQPLLDWLKEKRNSGHRILLYSASDQTYIDEIGSRFGIFEDVRGSDGIRNLSGLDKYTAIAGKYGKTFTYVGDSSKDLPIWEHCNSAVLVGNVQGLRRRLGHQVEVVAEFPKESPGLATWRKALRLHQWAKNALIFVPMLLSGSIFNFNNLTLALIAFLAFGLLASSTYIINDLYDLGSDRRHQTKRHRPLASGDLSLLSGVVAASLLLVAAAGLAIALLPRSFSAVSALYLMITLAYSIALKRQPILDMIVLAGLFTIRILAGIVVAGSLVSPWLLAFSMFFFGSLAAVKRYTECDALIQQGRDSIPGRGYKALDAPWLMNMGAACGFASVLVFFIYLVDAVTQMKQFRDPNWLWAICPALAYWLGRIWLLALRRDMREDPIAFALKDRLSLYMGVFVVASVCLALI